MNSPVSTAGNHRHPVRAVLGFGLVTGIAMTSYFLLIAGETPLAWDFLAYYRGAEAAIAGEAFVGLEPDEAGGEYVYPPIVVLVFVPYVLMGSWPLSFAIHGLLSLAMLVTLGILAIRELGRLGVELTNLDRVLIMAFAVISLYPLMSLGLGQIDPLVALLLAGVFVWVERSRDSLAGLALAGAAIIKLFPVAYAIWFLRLKRWRAVKASIVTGAFAVGLSFLIFGVEINRSFFDLILFERSRLDAFAEGVSPDFFSVTLVRPISSVLPSTVPPATYLVISLALVVPALLYVYRHTESPIDRHIAFLATLVAILIALPSTNLNHFLYLYFPVLVLVYSLDPGPPRRWLLVGTAVMMLPVQPAILVTTLETIPLTIGATAQMHQGAEAMLSVVSIGLIGAIIVLAACVRHAMERPVSPEWFDQFG